MKTNTFQKNRALRGFWNGDRQQQRHFFTRCLQLGWITTRGEEQMKLEELAFLTLCIAMGGHKAPEMRAFVEEQDLAPLMDENGINFLYYWEDALKNGPVAIDRIEFNQNGRFITVFEKGNNGIKKREFKNLRSAVSKYGSVLLVMDKMTLARLHSSIINTNSSEEAEQLTDNQLKALLS
jgi:hypothetical protein